jgi:hypothetical protein
MSGALGILFLIAIPEAVSASPAPVGRPSRHGRVQELSATQMANFRAGNCVLEMRSPFYQPPTLAARARSALSALTLPRARARLRAKGGMIGIARRALTENALTRLPSDFRAARQARLEGAVRLALRAARTEAERGLFRIGPVVELESLGGNRHRAKVAFISKRSGGKTERLVEINAADGDGLSGALGRLLGRAPTVTLVGYRPGISLEQLTKLAVDESLIAGQGTMFRLGLRPSSLRP